MSNSFRHLFNVLFGSTPPPSMDWRHNRTNEDGKSERDILKRFWKNPEEVVEELITWVHKSPVYTLYTNGTTTGRTVSSCSGHITVCQDIFGPEVKIYPSTFLLDCNPSTYGLSRESANRLYEAILTRVPGTSTFKFTQIEL